MTPGEIGRYLERIASDVEEVRTDVREIRTSTAATDKTVAVHAERLDKLEKFVYGALGASATALVTVVVTAVK